MESFYQVLEVSPTASDDEIIAAIKSKRKRFRQIAGSPDKKQAREAEVMMETLAEIETTLLDPSSRQKYDQDLAAIKEPPPSPVPEPIPTPAPQNDPAPEQTPQPPVQPAPQPPVPEPVDKLALLESTIQDIQIDIYDKLYRSAAIKCKKAIEDYDHFDIYDLYFQAAFELEEIDSAEFAASNMKRLQPDDPRTLTAYAMLSEAKGDDGQALGLYSRVMLEIGDEDVINNLDLKKPENIKHKNTYYFAFFQRQELLAKKWTSYDFFTDAIDKNLQIFELEKDFFNKFDILSRTIHLAYACLDEEDGMVYVTNKYQLKILKTIVSKIGPIVEQDLKLYGPLKERLENVARIIKSASRFTLDNRKPHGIFVMMLSFMLSISALVGAYFYKEIPLVNQINVSSYQLILGIAIAAIFINLALFNNFFKRQYHYNYEVLHGK